MRTTLNVNDIRRLIAKIKNKGATAFSKGSSSTSDFIDVLVEFAEYFELVFIRLEKVEDKQKSLSKAEDEIKKLRRDLDAAKVALNKVIERVNQQKN